MILLANSLYLKYKNYRTVGDIIGISKSTIQRWVANLDYYLKPKEKQVRERKLTSHIFYFVYELIQKNSLIRLKDIKSQIYTTFCESFSIPSISNIVKEIGYTYKTINKRNYNKSFEDIKEKEIIFKNTIKHKNLDVISIDESCFYFNDIPNKGWSLKGSKCIVQTPFKRNKQSLLLAISNKKVIHYLITPKSINGDTYFQFLKEINPKHKILIADNVSFHKSKRIIDYVQKNNTMLFIPPYSPEYNPIEFVFSEIKRNNRYTIFKTMDELKKYLIIQLETMNSHHLNNYFKHSLSQVV